MRRRFLTRIRDLDGVLRAEVVDRENPARGPLAAVAYVRSESGTLAVRELFPLLPESGVMPVSVDAAEPEVSAAAASGQSGPSRGPRR